MIKGIIFFEQGGLQQIDELSSLQNIIRTMEEALPVFRKKEKERILATLSKEDLLSLTSILADVPDPRQPYKDEDGE